MAAALSFAVLIGLAGGLCLAALRQAFCADQRDGLSWRHTAIRDPEAAGDVHRPQPRQAPMSPGYQNDFHSSTNGG